MHVLWQEQHVLMQAARAAQEPAPANTSSNAPTLEQEADADPTAYYENRLATVQQAKDSGSNPYPHKFHVDFSIPEYVEQFGKEVENGQQLERTVAIAGRIRTKRPSGSKLVFYDLVGDGAKVQIMASLSTSEHSEDADAFAKLHNGVKRGDVIGVIGHPGASKNGELSIFPVSMQVRRAGFHPFVHMHAWSILPAPLCGHDFARIRSVRRQHTAYMGAEPMCDSIVYKVC